MEKAKLQKWRIGQWSSRAERRKALTPKGQQEGMWGSDGCVLYQLWCLVHEHEFGSYVENQFRKYTKSRPLINTFNCLINASITKREKSLLCRKWEIYQWQKCIYLWDIVWTEHKIACKNILQSVNIQLYLCFLEMTSFIFQIMKGKIVKTLQVCAHYLKGHK